jgi:hypothetical protein
VIPQSDFATWTRKFRRESEAYTSTGGYVSELPQEGKYLRDAWGKSDTYPPNVVCPAYVGFSDGRVVTILSDLYVGHGVVGTVAPEAFRDTILKLASQKMTPVKDEWLVSSTHPDRHLMEFLGKVTSSSNLCLNPDRLLKAATECEHTVIVHKACTTEEAEKVAKKEGIKTSSYKRDSETVPAAPPRPVTLRAGLGHPAGSPSPAPS